MPIANPVSPVPVAKPKCIHCWPKLLIISRPTASRVIAICPRLFRGSKRLRAEPQGAGYLIVPPQGRIEGDICARHIVVSGEVIGNLHASDRVELLARARIIGNVSYGGMTMQAGCSVIGRLLQVDESNIPDERASLSAAPRARGYNLKLLIYKAGAFT